MDEIKTYDKIRLVIQSSFTPEHFEVCQNCISLFEKKLSKHNTCLVQILKDNLHEQRCRYLTCSDSKLEKIEEKGVEEW